MFLIFTSCVFEMDENLTLASAIKPKSSSASSRSCKVSSGFVISISAKSGENSENSLKSTLTTLSPFFALLPNIFFCVLKKFFASINRSS